MFYYFDSQSMEHSVAIYYFIHRVSSFIHKLIFLFSNLGQFFSDDAKNFRPVIQIITTTNTGNVHSGKKYSIISPSNKINT